MYSVNVRAFRGESEWLKEVQDYECRVLAKREEEEQV